MSSWRILIVDDDAQAAQQTAELLRSAAIWEEGDTVEIEPESSFTKALELLELFDYDLLILDVRDQASAETITYETSDHSDATDEGSDVTDSDLGIKVYEEVRRRRFLPIVFFTALPNLVQDLETPPFVSVVSKYASSEELHDRVREVFASDLPAIHRALLGHVDEIVRAFMADFVQPHWQALASPSAKGDLAHLLLRRLALSLAEGGDVLAERLATVPGVELATDQVHPMRYYLIPPVTSISTGDLFQGPQLKVAPKTKVKQDDDQSAGPQLEAEKGDTANTPAASAQAWYVLLTPACDLAHEKAEFVVLVECVPLESTPEYTEWASFQSRANEGAVTKAHRVAERRLTKLLKNRPEDRQEDRNFYLPGAWTVPNLLVDFQRVVSIPPEKLLSTYERVATLDSPYAEALVERFGRYLGRLGTPDLNISIPLERLRPA